MSVARPFIRQRRLASHWLHCALADTSATLPA
jgi:hypothetical protein